MFLSRTLTVSLFAVACLALAATAQPAPVTDGLKWDDGAPAATPPIMGVSQIRVSGTVDKGKYPDGRIFDKSILLEVYAVDKDGKAEGKALFSKRVGVIGDVFQSFTGTSQQPGGFPKGIYEVRVQADKFRETGGGTERKAVLVKEKYEVK